MPFVDEGRKRVLLIAASILVARHLKELNSGARTPALESLISDAIAVATRILQKIDSNFSRP